VSTLCVGALISALSLAVRKSVVGLARMLQIASAMRGGALVLFGLSHTLWISLARMVLVGFGLSWLTGASGGEIADDRRRSNIQL
jgi:hypothetical protein